MRHEIVHNRHVVDILKAKGAIFVEELDEIPETDAPCDLFGTWRAASRCRPTPRRRNLFYLDATCPLVSKVHAEAARHHESGLRDRPDRPCRPSRGDRHDGPAAAGRRDADRDRGGRRSASTPRDPERLAYITQTTLSVDDTAAIVAILKARFPGIVGPQQGRHLLRHHQPPGGGQGDRRRAATALIVVGAPNSSNSLRLVEVAERAGCPQGAAGAAGRRHSLGPSSRASPRSASPPAPRRPELLVDEIIDAFRARFDVDGRERGHDGEERIAFNVPRELREAGAP